MTIEQIKYLRETEDRVELKKAETQFSYKTGRKSVLGYVVALANEGGGCLILGVNEKSPPPHEITGSIAWKDKEGKLKQDIYRDLKIRVETEVLYDKNNRVLIIYIPSRPIGKVMKFEDIPLMKVGEELLPMDDDTLRNILNEQEPDFSSKICEGLTINDLDDKAIKIMKDKYAEKQRNSTLASLSDEQILSDLNLSVDGKLTYAAIILLGTKKSIRKYLNQSSTTLEFRSSKTKIERDADKEIQESLYTGIEKIWDFINQSLSNPKKHFQRGPYIMDILLFNEGVMREAILNAIAHRDYRSVSSVVVKQYPEKINILNPGGFPRGVTKENILNISSHPRNKLLMETLEKTGLVERSSQGVDKMYRDSLSDSKAAPDYSGTDDYQVDLMLDVRIRDYIFALFIQDEQKKRPDNELGVEDLIVLDKVRDGISTGLKEDVKERLLNAGLIRRSGGSTSAQYVLGEKYYEIAGTPSVVEGIRISDLEIIKQIYESAESAKMGDFVKAFDKRLTRPQVKYLIEKLEENKVLVKEGKAKGTKYKLVPKIAGSDTLLRDIINILESK